MSEPFEAVRAGLAGHAAGVVSAAPGSPVDVPGGVAAAVDVDALLARLAALEAAQQAAIPVPPKPDNRPTVAGASSGLADSLDKIHNRLVAVEEKLGIEF